MDTTARCQNFRIAGLIAVLLALLAVPASAAGGAPVIQPLPMPIPAIPSVVAPLNISDIPALSRAQLPQVSGLPSRMSAIATASNTSDAMLTRAEDTLNSTLTSLSAQLDSSRLLVASLRAHVGAPTADTIVKAQNVYGVYESYTAYDVATTMSNSVYTSTAYLRGLSRLGGVGLSLTFVILGLGWIVTVNLIDLGIRLSVYILKAIIGAIRLVWALVLLVIALLDVLGAWINILTGPFT